MEKRRRNADGGYIVPVPARPVKKKAKGRLVLSLILVFLLLALLGGAAASYIYDFFSLRSSIVGFFITQDDQYRGRMAQLDRREAALTQREAELNEQAAQHELTDKRQQRENERLEALRAELNAQDEDLRSRITAFDGSVAEFDNLVLTVAAMDPKSAAEMLETLWPLEDSAKLLNAMQPKKAAAILEKMSAAGAKKVAEKLISLSQ